MRGNTTLASGAARANDQKTPKRTQREEEGPKNRTLQIIHQGVESVFVVSLSDKHRGNVLRSDTASLQCHM